MKCSISADQLPSVRRCNDLCQVCICACHAVFIVGSKMSKEVESDNSQEVDALYREVNMFALVSLHIIISKLHRGTD